MNRMLLAVLICWIGNIAVTLSQTAGFDAFVNKIATQYDVDIAIAPSLIPRVDSLLEAGTNIGTLSEFIHHLLQDDNISYQFVDGNKLMLRQETHATPNAIHGWLEGTILNGADNTPLSWAAITFVKGQHGCMTNEAGFFSLPITDTNDLVAIHYLGFITQTLSVSELQSRNHSIILYPDVIPLEEVLIVLPSRDVIYHPATQSLRTKGYRIWSVDELLQNPAQDLIMTQSSYTPYSSHKGIRIRSNQSENALVVMDGLPVYDPYHFYNLFSPFNTHYFSSVAMYKNTIPIAYGGRIDGMVQLNSGRNTPSSHLIFDTDLLLTAIETQWNLPDGLTLKMGGRISHTKILNAALTDSVSKNPQSEGKFNNDNEWSITRQPAFEFYDINAGFSKEWKNTKLRQGSSDIPTNKISGTVYTSRDILEQNNVTSFETIGKISNERIGISQTYVGRDIWENMGAAVQSAFATGAQTTLESILSFSQYQKQLTFNTHTVENRPLHTITKSNSGFQQGRLQSIGIKSWLTTSIASGAAYQMGLDVTTLRTNIDASENVMSYVDQAQQESEITVFGDLNLKRSQQYDIRIGLRNSYLRSTSKVYLLPQLQGTWYAGTKGNLVAAYSKSLQTVYALEVENRYGQAIDILALSDPQNNFPVLLADKWMIGGGLQSTFFSVDIELFYKKISGISRIAANMPDPGFQNPSAGDAFYALYIGEGKAAGLEVNALYKKGRWQAGVYYMLSKMQERYPELFRGAYYSPEEDRRHQLKLSGAYHTGRWEASVLWHYKSKAPYVSLIRLEGRGGLGGIRRENVIRYLPSYLSLDLGLDYNLHIGKLPAQIGVSVINATDHVNISEIQHTGAVSRDMDQNRFFITQQTQLLGRTGNVHVRIVM